MNQPENRLSRRDAERLLDAPATHDSALGQALAAAAAPPHPHELHREDAAVAAFHTTRSTPPPARRTAFVSPTRLGSRAAVHAVVATGAVLVMGSGAFALAGSVDLPDLPTLPGQASDRATEAVSGTSSPTGSATSSATAPGSISSGTPDGTAGGSPSGKPTGKPTSVPSTSASGSPSATPSPNLPGLCRAFQATDRSDGRSLTSPAFAALVTAAGGADRVATYCVALIGAPQTGTPSGQPTPTSKPTPIPTGNPTPTPTGKPTDLPTPTGKPTDKPTPTDRPTPTDTPTPTPTGKPSEPPTGSPTDQPSPGKPTDAPEQSGRGGGKDSTTSGS